MNEQQTPLANAWPPGRGLAAIFGVMSRRRRIQLALTVILTLCGAIAELVTIGAVLPLLALVAKPDYFAQAGLIRDVLDTLGFEPGTNLIVPAALFLIVAALVSAAVRLLLSWTSYRFIYGLGADISMRIYHRMLRQPYDHYLRQNSSAAVSAVQKTYSVVVGIVAQVIIAFTAAVIALCILIFLFVIDPATAAFASIAIGLVYAVISFASKRALFSSSRRMSATQTARMKVLQESWGGMRDIILDHSEPIFERKLAEYENEMRRLQANASFISEAPRFVVESFGIIVVALLAVYFSFQPGGVLLAIPILGAFALGAQRLLPLVQTVFRAWTSYSINSHFLMDVVELMDAPVNRAALAVRGNTLPARVSIEARGLSFAYSPDDEVLKEINLSIRPGERVALIGKTGSGKSTLADVLMGLLTPSRGQILLGDAPLDERNIGEWQARIAHVPQSIFLSDDTIAANIAFGCGAGEIDMERVRHAADRADVTKFVERLPEGFETMVGERGIRLSGGQRQRIGIARALYKDASVLVFDEATSALDGATEAAVMEAVAGLDRDLTVILIAHRLSTVALCDRVYRLEAGRIVQSGSYEQIVGGPARASADRREPRRV